MAKSSTLYVCQGCGSVHAKWSGKCDGCGAWNTLAEEAASAPLGSGASAAKSTRKAGRLNFEGLEGGSASPPRIVTGIAEFDRTLGGGVAVGSAVLIGGDPGIGKSTLLLQASAGAARAGAKVAYVSGEESTQQIRARAARLKLDSAPVALAAETNLRDILDGLRLEKPDLVIIDSVQTMWSEGLDAAPGSVGQVRAVAAELVRFSKKTGAAVLLVGHVTKDGQIAGPRVMEHLVDVVLAFEGERGYPFRILRGLKNRFGPTEEIGVFEMSEEGLREVPNPSALFLDGRGVRASGAAVFAGIEGARPVLVEIQALVAPSSFGTPRRAVVGWDQGRLAMILAVLEARCGVSFGTKDVYLNVAGGLKISEPAADLAAAAALISSAFDTPLPEDAVVFGEVSLSGDIRQVGRMDLRLKEAQKLGFARAMMPHGGSGLDGTTIIGLKRLEDLVAQLSTTRQMEPA
jgi:DNA repair protein RadA/Sms